GGDDADLARGDVRRGVAGENRGQSGAPDTAGTERRPFGAQRRGFFAGDAAPCHRVSASAAGGVLMSKKSSSSSLADELRPLVAPFRIDGSKEFHLKSYDCGEKGG